LPMKCLVVGNFSQGHNPVPPNQRQRINVTPENFAAVLAQVKPQITCCDGKVHLTIQSLKDFHPEGLVQQVPLLQRLVAMRHLLRDLQGNLQDDRDLQRRLTQVLGEGKTRHALEQALAQHAPMQH
jgi:type VI secretion system protein ImpB